MRPLGDIIDNVRFSHTILGFSVISVIAIIVGLMFWFSRLYIAGTGLIAIFVILAVYYEIIHPS